MPTASPYLYGSRPTSVYDEPFNPRATPKCFQPRQPKPRQDGPYISLDKDDLADHSPAYRTGSRRERWGELSKTHRALVNTIKLTGWTQVALRMALLLTSIGLLVCVICVRRVESPGSWLIRVPVGIALLASAYGIYSLISSKTVRTPQSAASYHFFALIVDLGCAAFFVATSMLANSSLDKPQEDPTRWQSITRPSKPDGPVDDAAYKAGTTVTTVIFWTALAAAIQTFLSAIISIVLVVAYRQVARLPPDENPLERDGYAEPRQPNLFRKTIYFLGFGGLKPSGATPPGSATQYHRSGESITTLQGDEKTPLHGPSDSIASVESGRDKQAVPPPQPPRGAHERSSSQATLASHRYSSQSITKPTSFLESRSRSGTGAAAGTRQGYSVQRMREQYQKMDMAGAGAAASPLYSRGHTPSLSRGFDTPTSQSPARSPVRRSQLRNGGGSGGGGGSGAPANFRSRSQSVESVDLSEAATVPRRYRGSRPMSVSSSATNETPLLSAGGQPWSPTKRGSNNSGGNSGNGNSNRYSVDGGSGLRQAGPPSAFASRRW